MSNVVPFVSKPERDASNNLQEFIDYCRYELTLYGSDLVWDDVHWVKPGAVFVNLDRTRERRDLAKPLLSPFIDFAKAYYRHRQTHRQANDASLVAAFRCLERALVNLNGRAELGDINFAALDAAAQIARDRFGTSTAYGAGRELATIAKFVSDNHLVSARLDWRNPLKRPQDTVRTGIAAKERRDAKLPHQDALNALGDIFASNPTDPADIYTTSVSAMLLCAPSRISEIHSLPVDCEVEEAKADGTIAYGWRFRPKKGGDPMIKWIPDVMVDVAKEAIRRIRELTAEARIVAAWLENEACEPCDHPPLAQITLQRHFAKSQAYALIGNDLRYAEKIILNGRTHYSLQSLHAASRQSAFMRYPDFPYLDKAAGLLFSEALFCFPRHALRRDLEKTLLSLWAPDSNKINALLGGRSGTVDIFDRHGCNLGRDNPLKLTSHQFRHLITTAANRGGLSLPEITRWRGSKDVRQNRAYNHMSEFELVELVRRDSPSLIPHPSRAEMAESIRLKLPMTTAEFNAMHVTTAHVTEIGFCIHDFVMSPCQKFRDCINCTEQVCIKGDKRLSQLESQLELVQSQLDASVEAAAEGLYGADPWTHIQTLTRDRLKDLLMIRDDPSIPDGSVVRLANPKEFSPAKRAIDSQVRASLPGPIAK